MSDVALLDIRVGKIIKIWKHATRENLYCENVDMGNGEIRTIASGLVDFVPMEELDQSLCLVLANLKARKIESFES